MNSIDTSNIQNQQAVASTVKSSSYQNVVHKKEVGTIILTETNLTFYPLSGAPPQQSLWTTTIKHQVSPVTHPRYLLKLLLNSSANDKGTKGDDGNKNTISHTYELQSRNELERIRQDISNRLINSRRVQALNADQVSEQRKRKIGDITSGTHPESSSSQESSALTSLSNYEQSVSCSSILASDRNIRTEHNFLTATKPIDSSLNLMQKNEQEPIVQESDFWSTHSRKVSNQYAKIQGYIKKGMSSSIKSSLDIQISGNTVSKPVRLGVDEIRQIFIMYPAVHAAYEEKVPLELSEEQFWRKYLESEYFHRDRGRLGAFTKTLNKKDDENVSSHHLLSTTDGTDTTEIDKKGPSKDEENKSTAKEREENARMGAVSSSDIFARKEIELQKREAQSMSSANKQHSSVNIAVGKFDLTTTANTERGSKLLLKSTDLEPSDDRARKVIEKYNKHWAIVLNSDRACTGCDVTDLVRESIHHVIEGDDDAQPNGGVEREMQQLVKFASAVDCQPSSVDEFNDTYDDSELVLYRELKLSNINAYNRVDQNQTKDSDHIDREIFFSRSCIEQLKFMVQPLIEERSTSGSSYTNTEVAFPEAGFGRNLLMALTKHMVRDAMTETDTAKQVKLLPEEFRMQLTSYTRRSYELLRHFFALRHVIDEEMKQSNSTSRSSQKLEKIVKAMEKLFRELEIKRNELPQSDRGEQMRVMMLQTMEQLDWAIQLNPTTSRKSGGFVTVAD